MIFRQGTSLRSRPVAIPNGLDAGAGNNATSAECFLCLSDSSHAWKFRIPQTAEVSPRLRFRLSGLPRVVDGGILAEYDDAEPASSVGCGNLDVVGLSPVSISVGEPAANHDMKKLQTAFARFGYCSCRRKSISRRFVNALRSCEISSSP